MKNTKFSLWVLTCVLLVNFEPGLCNKREREEIEEDEVQEDPYSQHMESLMADLHRVYSGKIENLHADFNKRFMEQEQRYERRYTALEQKYDALANGLSSNDRERRLSNRQGMREAAFYVQLTHDLPGIGNHQTIVFDLVLTNILNGYNQADGVFTVPLTGVYVFVWTTTTTRAYYMQTELVVNAQVKGKQWSDSRSYTEHASATGSAVLSITKGDTVWIRTNTVHNNHLTGGQFTSFSGWLMY